MYKILDKIKNMLVLLILCFFVHFLADFTKLSTNRMLKAKSEFKSFLELDNLFGIAAHASVHGLLLFLVSIPFIGWYSLLFGLVNLLLHCAIDCGKPLLTNYLVSKEIKAGDSSNVWFWTVFGLDQFLHALTIILTVFIFV